MLTEKERVLEMLKDGKITADEAAKLLAVLGEKPEKRAPLRAELKGRKLRVLVMGSAEGADNINVNVSVPLALARLADGIITSVVPNDVNKQLEGHGINLKGLNIGEIIDTLSDLDEDIVNVDVTNEGKPIKVRVYVE